jgi:hypothetical protein
MKVIITHQNVDLDAVASVWAWQRLVKPAEEFGLIFLPAEWQPKNEELKDGDVILDMLFGIKGIKNDSVSCFAYLLGNYFTNEDKLALEKLAKFVEAIDRGNVIKNLLDGRENDILSFTCLNAVLQAFQKKYYNDDKMVCEKMAEIFDGLWLVAQGVEVMNLNLEEIFKQWVWTKFLGFVGLAPNLEDLIYKEISNRDLAALDKVIQFVIASRSPDVVEELLGEKNEIISFVSLSGILWAYEAKFKDERIVFEKMCEIFDGMLATGRSRLKIEDEAKDKTEWVTKNIAIVKNAKGVGVNGAVFQKGAKIIIFVDGNNMGIIRRDDFSMLRMDDEIIKEALGDEKGNWFFHHSGYLAACGTRKSPKETPSKIDPYFLAQAANELLKKHNLG